MKVEKKMTGAGLLRNSRARLRWTWLITGSALLLTLLVETGCGASGGQSGPAPPVGPAGTRVFVAVTGAAERNAGNSNTGMAIVNPHDKEIEQVNLPETGAPQGIIFAPATSTAPGTAGRVTHVQARTILLGNAADGSVTSVDVPSRSVSTTTKPAAGCRLSTSGMYKGPDGTVYMASLSDGNIYPYNQKTGAIGRPWINQAGATSVSGMAWSPDGRYIYLLNTYDPGNPGRAPFLAKIEWPGGRLAGRIENVATPSPGGPMTEQPAMSPDGAFLYVPDSAGGSLAKVDLADGTVVRRIPLGAGNPCAVVLSADGATGYIAVRNAPRSGLASVLVMNMGSGTIEEVIPGIQAPVIGGLVLEEPAAAR